MENIIVGLAGRSKSGKNTAANTLTDILKEGGISSSHISFAYPLKRMIIDTFGIPEENVFGSQKKRLVSFGTWGDYFSETIPDGILKTDRINVRDMMRHLGTDIFRSRVDRNFWVKSFRRRINNNAFDEDFPADTNNRVVIVTDIRFENEVDCVTKLNGYNIKLDRVVPYNSHASEEAVDLIPDEKFWRILDDDQINGLKKLRMQMSSVLYGLEII